MTRLQVRLTVLVVVVGALLGALPANAAVADRRLPPPDREDLVRIFDPKVADLGFRTTRARLQNLETYEVDDEGRHLAVYLEPIEEGFTDAEYVAAVTETAKVFLPMVFKRWKGLESFDVCLEPLPTEDSSESPPPITQLLVTRDGLRDVKWKTVTLGQLIAASNANEAAEYDERTFYMYFVPRLDEQPELIAARAEANEP